MLDNILSCFNPSFDTEPLFSYLWNQPGLLKCLYLDLPSLNIFCKNQIKVYNILELMRNTCFFCLFIFDLHILRLMERKMLGGGRVNF